MGQVRSRPETARFRLTVTARANSAAAARNACDAAQRDLQAKLRSVGVPDAAITVLPPVTSQIGFIGNEAYSDDETPNPAGAAALLAMARQQKIATVGVQIELTDMNRLASVRQVLLDREDVTAQPPTLSLRDDTAARRAAISQAIAKAKEEAEAYAAALGLRVSRIVRVFDPAATSEQPQVWSQMITLMNGGTGTEVVTDARVGMEVVLAPR
nr:SIMPL domain-containing protein [Sphingomonas profundi]